MRQNSIGIIDPSGHFIHFLHHKEHDIIQAYALDLQRGYLFRSYCGNSGTLTRSDTNGQNEIKLHSKKDSCITQIIVQNKDLFWYDEKIGKIEASDSNGKSRKVLKSLEPFITGRLEIFHGKILFVSMTKSVLINPISTVEEQVALKLLSNTASISVQVDEKFQRCHKNCEQICLLSAQKSKCVCSAAYTLHGNRCLQNTKNLLVFTTGSQIRTLNLNFEQLHSIEINMTTSPKNAVAIDFDSERNSFIYSDNGRQIIAAVDLE